MNDGEALKRRARLPALGLSLVAAALIVSAASSSGRAATAAQQQVIVYAVPTTAQFMNHADDRVRGMTVNPFNANLKALQVVLSTNGKEKGNGPFPGDDVLYTFNLYTRQDHKTSAGSAIFTCYYGFGKHATCDSYFDLGSGLVLAEGQVAFNNSNFTWGVSGGTSKYLGARGELTAAPAADNALRLNLKLLGLAK